MRSVIILILGYCSTPGTVCWLLGGLCCDWSCNLQQAGQTYWSLNVMALVQLRYFHDDFISPLKVMHHSPIFSLPWLLFISPILGQSSCWLDNFPTNCACIRASIFSTHAVWLLSVACAVCLLRRRLLFPLLLVHSVPTSTHLGSTPVTPHRHRRGMSREGYSFALCGNYFKFFKA